MSKGTDIRGDNFLLEAEKALKRTTIFGFGKNQKFEDAAENFTKAGNAFKIAKDWLQAGNSFLKSADCYSKTDSSSDALNTFIEAGNCFKNIDTTKAIECMTKAIEIYNDGGRFGPTAKIYKDMAEIYEQDNNIPLAIENYQMASDIMSSDNKKQTAQQCLLKIATLSSLQDEPGLHRASEIFVKGEKAFDIRRWR